MYIVQLIFDKSLFTQNYYSSPWNSVRPRNIRFLEFCYFSWNQNEVYLRVLDTDCHRAVAIWEDLKKKKGMLTIDKIFHKTYGFSIYDIIHSTFICIVQCQAITPM